MKSQNFKICTFGQNLLVLFLALGCSHQSKESVPQISKNYQGFGLQSVSPEILKLYAPPPVDSQRKNQIEKMLDVATPGAGRLSEDGKTLYFTWRISGTSQVWKMQGPLAYPQQLTSGTDAAFIFDLTKDGRYLIIQRDSNGQENPGIYQVPVEGGPVEKLFVKDNVQAFAEFLSKDGQFLYFSANDIHIEDRTFYKIHLKTKKIELVFQPKGQWFIADKNQEESLLLFGKSLANNIREYFVFDVQTKSLTPVIGQNESEDYFVRFAGKQNQYVISTSKFSDFKRLYLYDENKKWTPVSEDVPYEIEYFFLSEDKSWVVYGLNQQGYSQFKVRQMKQNFPLVSLQIPKAENVTPGYLSDDRQYMVLTFEDSHRPRRHLIYNFRTQTLQEWLRPQSPEVNLSQFVPATVEHYVARDQTKIPMVVRRPKQCINKACPVVVEFHGGPEGQSTPGYSAVAQLFVDAGFIFVEPNVRGSSGYGKSWLNADNAEKRKDVITDIEDCALYLRKNWQVTKIGVMGASYGGYAALMAMSRFAGAYDAGISNVGMSNLYSFLLNTAPYRRALRVKEYGDPETQKTMLLELSPTQYIHKIKSPLMIIQGANDPRVPVGEAVQMQNTLSKNKIPSSLVIFADEGHGASKKSNRVVQYGLMLDFFAKHLQ